MGTGSFRKSDNHLQEYQGFPRAGTLLKNIVLMGLDPNDFEEREIDEKVASNILFEQDQLIPRIVKQKKDRKNGIKKLKQLGLTDDQLTELFGRG